MSVDIDVDDRAGEVDDERACLVGAVGDCRGIQQLVDIRDLGEIRALWSSQLREHVAVVTGEGERVDVHDEIRETGIGRGHRNDRGAVLEVVVAAAADGHHSQCSGSGAKRSAQN